MIRNVKHNGKDYIVVDTILRVGRGGDFVASPIHIRVDINKFSEEDRELIHKKVNGLFNRIITLKDTPVAVSKSKPWWKKIF